MRKNIAKKLIAGILVAAMELNTFGVMPIGAEEKNTTYPLQNQPFHFCSK